MLAPFLLLASAPGEVCQQMSVHDGDTIRCGDERIRLLEIEAPELKGSPRCRRPKPRDWCDDALAQESRDALADFLSTGPVLVHRDGRDFYGRTLAHLSVNGQDAGAYLISIGLAREYR
nr:thermonuclease family protein [Croceicoccus sp. YJ47]